MEKISIIVPVYKTEKYLRRCIESILSQSYTNFEVIIVNDGSPDNSQVIIDELVKEDSRIKSIYKENSGPSSARNVGIEASTGSYILFCDSDDTVQPNWIMELYNAVKKRKTSMVITGFYRVNEEGTILNTHIIPEGDYSKERYYELIGPGLVGSTCNKIYERKIVEDAAIRFNENIKHGEDVIFNLAYLKHMKDIYVIEKVTYNYYQYSEIETLSMNVSFEEKLYIFKMRLPFISERYIEAYEKSFLYSSWEYAKEKWLVSNNRKVFESIILNDTIQMLIKKYGAELFDKFSLWALLHRKISFYIIIQQISQIKKKLK